MIFHINDSVRGREWINHDKIAITLKNLKGEIVVCHAWNAKHVAFCFRVRGRPLGAVFVALCKRLRQIRNRASTDDALTRWNRSDRAELPKVFELFRRMRLEIPISRVYGLPNTIKVRMS